MEALTAVVIKKDGKHRPGRGFSRDELKMAGISSSEALKLGIPVDSRRKTAYRENVDVIKRFLKRRKTLLKPEKRRKSKS